MLGCLLGLSALLLLFNEVADDLSLGRGSSSHLVDETNDLVGVGHGLGSLKQLESLVYFIVGLH